MNQSIITFNRDRTKSYAVVVLGDSNSPFCIYIYIYMGTIISKSLQI